MVENASDLLDIFAEEPVDATRPSLSLKQVVSCYMAPFPRGRD
jgi:hypothetical protein